MTHSEFLDRLDAEILTGHSLASIARSFEVNQVTVRRRKSALRAAGHVFAATQGFALKREGDYVLNNR
jgi:transposase-like protein